MDLIEFRVHIRFEYLVTYKNKRFSNMQIQFYSNLEDIDEYKYEILYFLCR